MKSNTYSLESNLNKWKEEKKETELLSHSNVNDWTYLDDARIKKKG